MWFFERIGSFNVKVEECSHKENTFPEKRTQRAAHKWLSRWARGGSHDDLRDKVCKNHVPLICVTSLWYVYNYNPWLVNWFHCEVVHEQFGSPTKKCQQQNAYVCPKPSQFQVLLVIMTQSSGCIRRSLAQTDERR